MVTVNALTTSDYVIVPIKAERFSMDVISLMLDFVRKIESAQNLDISILVLLLTHFDERLRISKNIEKEIKEKVGSDIERLKENIAFK